MLEQANNCCRRLWKDESGVVLATTIVVFLTLFVIACSVYVYGETVRQRIEVQNAADAAAYSAAVVQADALSRLASINRAMGWTYIQQGKMCMDYIVDKWTLLTILKHWLPDLIKAKIASLISCREDWYVGRNKSQQKALHQNYKRWLDVEDVIQEHKAAAGEGKSFLKLLFKILKCNININAMNKAEVKIIDKLEDRLHKAVKKSLQANIDDLRNDKLAKDRRADIRFALLTEPKKCFKIEKSEGMFIRAVYGRGNKPDDLLGNGAGKWFYNTPGTIQRKYRDQGNTLVYSWTTFYRIWIRDPITGICDIPIYTHRENERENEVWASEFEDKFYSTAVCEPQILTVDYFDKAGAIVVGVARRMHNPFQYMFPHRKPGGIYGLYTVPRGTEGGSHYVWGAAAARAGYRDLGRPAGTYNPTVDSFEQEYDPVVPVPEVPAWWKRNHGWLGLSPYNLTQTDWDAVFLPLHRAWSGRTPSWQNRPPGGSGLGAPRSPGRWKSATAADLLDELWRRAAWEGLNRRKADSTGLRSVASGEGPEGMGGAISYGGMEDHVYH